MGVSLKKTQKKRSTAITNFNNTQHSTTLNTTTRTDRLVALVARQARVDHAVGDRVAAHVERAPLLGDRLGEADLFLVV